MWVDSKAVSANAVTVSLTLQDKGIRTMISPLPFSFYGNVLILVFFLFQQVASYGGKLRYTISYVPGSRGAPIDDIDVQIIVSTMFSGIQRHSIPLKINNFITFFIFPG